jgi:hypothetical protein
MTPNDNTAIALSSDESRILNALTKPDAQLEVILPKEATADELWNTLEICTKGVNYMRGRINRLSIAVGGILARFHNKPSLHKSLGYETFADFRRRGVEGKIGMSRSFLYESMGLAENWPKLTQERYAKIGPKKMQLLSKVTDGHSSQAESLLKKAETMGVTDLRHYLEEEGKLTVDESVGRTIEIPTTLAVYRQWYDFSRSPEIQAVVGKADAGEILRALMQEFHNEWLVQGAGLIEEEKEHGVIRSLDVHESNAAQAGSEN